jgi:hypothetical protein
MTELTANRTLVKSPPELWAECSDAAALARHLGQFGEIRITRLEPETAVAWEGERASGTVRLEPSGWGTKVVLTAQVAPAADEVEEPQPEVAPPPEPPEPPAPRKSGLLARWRAMFRRREPPPEPVVVVEPEEPEEPVAPPEEPDDAATAEAALAAALDSLGQAHHRPFSRG